MNQYVHVNILKLNLGCGGDWRYGDEWLNVDANPGWEESCPPNAHCKCADLRDLSFLDAETVSEITTRHAIEHIPYPDIPQTFSEWYRVLRHGADVYIICPDLYAICTQFLQLNTAEAELDALDMFFGSFNTQWAGHQGGFTMRTLVHQLEQAGFEILSADYFPDDSDSPSLKIRALKP